MANQQTSQRYSIGYFSQLIGLSIDTLRYYEKEGLITPARNQQNQRVYTEKDRNWLAFILRLKQTGMPINEIKIYAKLRYQGDETVHERLELLYHQQEALEKQRQEIDDHLLFLAEKIKIYKKMIDME